MLHILICTHELAGQKLPPTHFFITHIQSSTLSHKHDAKKMKNIILLIETDNQVLITLRIYIYGGCSKFFLIETAILSPKKITLAKLSSFPQKTFAGPYVGLYLGNFVRKQKLDKGNLRV